MGQRPPLHSSMMCGQKGGDQGNVVGVVKAPGESLRAEGGSGGGEGGGGRVREKKQRRGGDSSKEVRGGGITQEGPEDDNKPELPSTG
eukprot:764346-Hanusia_phi.AAC.4